MEICGKINYFEVLNFNLLEIVMKTVYLDNNATTPLHPEVKKAIVRALEVFGNPSSMHTEGRRAHEEIEKSRATIAGFINADPSEIIFTGSGSEGNNTVFNSVFLNIKNRKQVITSNVEHPCVLESGESLAQKGIKVINAPVKKNGIVDLGFLKRNVTNKTALVSVMQANNETGTIQPIKEIARIAKKKGAFVHSDCVQALGKIKVDVKELGVDFLTVSGHKVYAPKGVGVLYVKDGIKISPLIYGGHQEEGKRAGTENTIGIIAFGKAVEMLKKEMTKNNQRIKRLRDYLKKGIQEKISDIIINGDQKSIVPNTLNVTFKHIEGESILLHLDLAGIAVSTGSACSTGSLEPSHVVMALKVPVEYAHGSIRFSLGRETTKQDIDYVLAKLPPIIEKLRKMSPIK